ncbi:craniofacial development protein 2-like [Octopus sinensis]|uniref:Craniofacial development protein 2-like n=1 Tax=Octopus sinensis TaxID=2607531 RepID=A0A6P7TRU3_9MOLL|nr:craniofacial development protein 2-like [Octopus sinensis]
MSIKHSKQSNELTILTFNVRGLKTVAKRHLLCTDLEKYQGSICCLQETKVKHGLDEIHGNYRLILLPSESIHYGQGFAIHKNHTSRLYRYWKVSDRISVLQLRTISSSKSRRLTSIVNVYAPHSGRIQKNPEELDIFYEELGRTLTDLGSSYFLFVAGDWNAKVGTRKGNESFIGHHGRGIRNYPGTVLAEFCRVFDLFLCNIGFQHPARHKTTWTGQRPSPTAGSVNIFNQIDYIVCRAGEKSLLRDSRSYGGAATYSDHKIVSAKFAMKTSIDLRRRGPNADVRIRHKIEQLCSSTLVRDNYQLSIMKSLGNINAELSPGGAWAETMKGILLAADEAIGLRSQVLCNKGIHSDLPALIKEQKELRLQLENTSDPKKKQILQNRRSSTQKKIKMLNKTNFTNKLDLIAAGIEQLKDSSKMFTAIRLLNRKKQTNKLKIHDSKDEDSSQIPKSS